MAFGLVGLEQSGWCVAKSDKVEIEGNDQEGSSESIGSGAGVAACGDDGGVKLWWLDSEGGECM